MPQFLRGGGTIPALALFQDVLGADTLVFAFSLPDANIHAPNEHMRLSVYHLAQRAYVKLLWELGAGGATGADKGEL